MKVLVTGATGFVGRRLCARLLAGGHAVVAAVRDAGGTARVPAGAESVVVGDLAGPVDWSGAVRGAECVVHLAARVHVLHETASDAAERFRRLNVQATTALADAAARAGVRRFVFASSVKAAAEQSASPLRESDPPGPLDPYGESKLEAERALLAAHARGAVEAVIVRPPLVYVPEVGGNFRRLLALAWHARRVPLPLGGIRNRRSLVFVDNLADALVRVAESPAAAGEAFYVRDDEDLSTSELIARLARAFGWEARLLAMPMSWLRGAAGLVGRAGEADRLLGTLQVDASKLRRLTGWAPPVDVDRALAATARWYREARRS